ncbi:MAG: hypothetical protein JNK57_20450 [Planctomycetaceae bacterium]|nr:hypothetical protein [Planctomycetaceae bacterium]
MKFWQLFILLAFFNFAAPSFGQDARSEAIKEIEKLEKSLREQPKDSFNWSIHNSLNYHYWSIDPRKAMEHVEVIFKHQPLDDYTKMVIGGKDSDRAKAKENLLKITVNYPDLKCTQACCFIWLAELASDKTEARQWYEKAAALEGLSPLCQEAVEDFYLFKIAERLPWPNPIPAPQGLHNRPGPWNDTDDLTIWPNTVSRANSDPWIAENHDQIRQMRPRLLLINFSNEHSREHIKKLTLQMIAALAESSRYHGYKNKDAPIFLDYQIFKFVDLRDADSNEGDCAKVPNKTPGRSTPFNFKYRSLFSQEFADYYAVPDPRDPSRNLRLDELLDGGYVHEVWFYGSASPKTKIPVGGYEVVEEKPRYDANFRRIGDEWVQAGNGGDSQQPWVGRSCRINGFDCTRGIGCALENLGHGLEGLSHSGAIPYYSKYFPQYAGFDLKQRYNLPIDSLYGAAGPNTYQRTVVEYPNRNKMIVDHDGKRYTVENYVAAGGNVHFPPNGTRHYDQDNDKPVMSTIEDWRIGSGPGGTDVALPYTSAKIQHYRDMAPDCMGAWLIYWRQNMPGLDNKQKDDEGRPMKNWMPFLFY